MKLAITFLQLSFASVALSATQHMICRDIRDLLPISGSSSLTRSQRGPPGPVGRPGPKEEPGERGDQGDPAEIDVARIEQIIDEKIAEATELLKTEFREMIEGATTETEDSASASCSSVGGLSYDGKCYIVIIQSSRDVTLTDAKELCSAKNARLADIPNRDHQMAVSDFGRKKLPAQTSEWQLWLGMTYDIGASAPRTSTGTLLRDSDFTWDSSYPSSSSSNTGMLLEIDYQTSTSQGMWNGGIAYAQHGAVCQL